jgi:hypothetical protein
MDVGLPVNACTVSAAMEYGHIMILLQLEGYGTP